jgi:hypothetical protein
MQISEKYNIYENGWLINILKNNISDDNKYFL